MDARSLGEHLRRWVVDKLTETEQQFPGLVLPQTFGGHAVTPDPYAHLLKTMTILMQLGVERIGATDLRERSLAIANATPTDLTGFSSFNYGESVRRLGGLDVMDDPDRVIAAVRDAELIRKILENDRPPPPNWVMVAARILSEEERLTGARPPELDEFVARTAALMAASGTGWVNDMFDPLVHFDMYTPDMYIFAEPIRDEIGAGWDHGFRSVIADLDHLVQPDGTIVWGRSSGLLALAMTIEIAGYGARHGLLDPPTPWFDRARVAADRLGALLPDGLNAAHQHRMTMRYRGPARRLQMGFDLVDKVAAAARHLLEAPPTAAAPPAATWTATDTLVRPDLGVEAAVWGYRSRSLSFVVPVMRGLWTEYVTSPRSPGVLEPPTQTHVALAPWFPDPGDPAHPESPSRWMAPAGLPDAIEKAPGSLTVTTSRWGHSDEARGDARVIDGARRVTFSVDGRTLSVHEQIRVDHPDVGQVTVDVPETADRRLDVRVGGDASIRTVDTSGIAEWRGYWHELPTVHQVEIPLVDGRAEVTWSVTPELRIGFQPLGHIYGSYLFRSLHDRLRAVELPPADEHLADALLDLDVFHIGWPEYYSWEDPTRAATAIRTVHDAGLPIVWTQHNLVPHHSRSDEMLDIYRQWAAAADVVVHHSEWGRDLARQTHPYRDDCRHVVLPHGYWDHRFEHIGHVDRARAERVFRWEPVPIRLAVIGAPRIDKQVQDVLDAFSATDRDDMELVIRLNGGETLPDDPRIHYDYLELQEQAYARKLKAVDAVILPFDPDGQMLTTGTAADIIGAGTGVICSDWGYAREVFAGAEICYGSGATDLQACLQGLTVEQLEASKTGVMARRAAYRWDDIAADLLALYEELVP